MNYDDFIELAKKRRSIRKYLSKPISENDIEKILNAGIQAPSGTNIQGWKFRILQKKDDINKLATVIEEKVIKLSNEYGDSIIKRGMLEYGANFFFFKNAPLVVMAYAKKPTNLSQYFFKDGLNNYKGSGTFLSMGMVLQNIMLAATTLDIGSCVLTGPLLAEDEIDKIYIPPKRYELCGVISLGYYDKEIKGPGRKEISNFIID